MPCLRRARAFKLQRAMDSDDLGSDFEVDAPNAQRPPRPSAGELTTVREAEAAQRATTREEVLALQQERDTAARNDDSQAAAAPDSEPESEPEASRGPGRRLCGAAAGGGSGLESALAAADGYGRIAEGCSRMR